MQSEAYSDWMSLYNDNIQTIWREENTELRKVSMIYYAFEKELSRLKNVLENELSSIKSEFKKREYLEKRRKFSGLVQSEKFELDAIENVDKENKSPEIVPLEQYDLNKASEEFFIESANTAAFLKESSPVPQCSKNVTATSPVLHKNSFNFKKKKSVSPCSDKTTPKMEIFNEDSTTSKMDDSNILECSIINNTPEVTTERKMKRPRFRSKKKKPNLNTSKQKNTLTQSFLRPKTCKREMDSNLPSMTITEMINLINDSDHTETDAESDATVDLEVPSQSETNLEPPSSPEKKKAKFVYEEVVRGKARKKLAGWACRECQEYYEDLNLPPEELQKKKNQCSKHRHRFKPREETYTGFWDLTFGPTPKTQQDEESLVFNYKKS
ncbi:hypothetical protein Zmor_026160 [Zophobas morio]|uniref:DNA endonuclease activator Ctp1 C-terminal domain-containing protein n=1 Tax=Zophobas morio TaxID=2755281 RepID=A0AA38HT19_9CUCU|nr:hypothetical protein Zmor_026160 [Zophobas morio]